MALVVVGQTTGFACDAFEDIVDERVHDGHGLGGDTGVGVDLLEHTVDVDGVGFLSGLPALLSISRLAADLLRLDGFLGSFS